MWLFKLLFLLALIASWMPVESKAEVPKANTTFSHDFESDEDDQEEELEEEVVV